MSRVERSPASDVPIPFYCPVRHLINSYRVYGWPPGGTNLRFRVLTTQKFFPHQLLMGLSWIISRCLRGMVTKRVAKPITHFITGGLTFLAGVMFICISSCKLITSIPENITSSHKHVVHSSENNSPYSVLEGTTIRIKPYNATFEIPEDWLTPKRAPDEHIKNLFFSWPELDEVNQIDGEANGFDEQEAQVINSVLPFENCVAHVGDRGWGNGLWNDLQVRVYVADWSPEVIISRVEKQGLDKASELFERASVKSGNRGEWQMRSLDILDAPSWSDVILGERLDFYYRAFGNKTVIIVFLHTDKFDPEIGLILDSFKWGM